MNLDPFETELTRQPLRGPPTAWRDDILAAAAQVAPTQHATFQTGWGRWRELFSPGWIGLGAAWILVVMIHRYSIPSDPASTMVRVPLSPAAIAAVRAQQRELLEVAGLAPETTDRKVDPAPAARLREERRRGPRAQGPGSRTWLA